MRANPDKSPNTFVAGVDEAGRGPLAGPVVASAVILADPSAIPGLDDSKKLSARRREILARLIRERALCWSVAWADRAEIDALNILGATLLAMRRAVLGLRIQPAIVRVDGNRLPDLAFFGSVIHGETVVGGDATVPAISAASILAKTTRDRIMMGLDEVYPAYAFAAHKGYPTTLHQSRLERNGPCAEHRRSFAPVSRILRAAV
jgi:ribonuclease HII